MGVKNLILKNTSPEIAMFFLIKKNNDNQLVRSYIDILNEESLLKSLDIIITKTVELNQLRNRPYYTDAHCITMTLNFHCQKR